MNKQDYVNDIVGLRWVEGSDDPAVGLDCWGVIYDSFMRVDGIELPDIFNRVECDLDRDGKAAIDDGIFVESPKTDGAVWTLEDADGYLVHVGRILCGKAVHSAGSKNNGGSVVAWPVRQAFKYYETKGFKIKFWRLADWLKS